MKSLSNKSDWSAQQAIRFLESFEGPLRIATPTTSGFPLICSLWYQYREGRILCATQEKAAITRHLRRDGRCAFELSPNEPPYFGLRGQGMATISTAGGAEILEQVSARYLGETESPFRQWLRARSAEEVVIQIEPSWVTTWDYRERMAASDESPQPLSPSPQPLST